MMSEENVEFAETSFLRLTSLLSLGGANLYLIHDNWLMFSLFLFASIVFEVIRLKLYEVLHHNHHVHIQNKKMYDKKMQEEALAELRRQSTR